MQLLTGLDLIFFVVVILSSLMAYFHGLTYEFFSVLAWIGASFATLYGLDYAQPLVIDMIGGSKGWLSATIAAAVIFVVSFILLSVISHSMSKVVKGSDFKAIDRSLGVLFGILRGLLLMGVFYLIYIWTYPKTEDQAPWIKKTRMLGVIKLSAKVVRDVLPNRFAKEFKDELFLDEKTDAYQKLVKPDAKATTKEVKNDGPHGYKESERRELEKQILMTMGEALSEEDKKELDDIVSAATDDMERAPASN